MTLRRTRLRIATHIIIKRKIMALSDIVPRITALSIMKLIIILLSIMILSIKPLNIVRLSITILTIATLRIMTHSNYAT